MQRGCFNAWVGCLLYTGCESVLYKETKHWVTVVLFLPVFINNTHLPTGFSVGDSGHLIPIYKDRFGVLWCVFFAVPCNWPNVGARCYLTPIHMDSAWFHCQIHIFKTPSYCVEVRVLSASIRCEVVWSCSLTSHYHCPD